VTPINWVRRRYLFNYCELLTMAIRRPRTIGRLLGLRSRLFMHRQLRDPELRRKVMPDYTFGCKRVLFSSHYLRTLARPNVELVTEPLSEVTEHGIRTADGLERQFDCIIWGTGFRLDFGWIEADLNLSPQLYPEQTWGVSPHEGLYFMGLQLMHTRKSGLIFGVGEDAEHISGVIARQLGAAV
jgi:cation diffusion facilitator CzcD-associated flavoprotein CzcO